MDKLFTSLAESDPVCTDIVSNRKLPLWGRTLTVPESSGSVARFTFADLCNKPLSAADYLEVTSTFGTVFVEDIPRMGLSERDQARRFITFIDGAFPTSSRDELTYQRAMRTRWEGVYDKADRSRPSSLPRPKYPSFRCFPTNTASLQLKTNTPRVVSPAARRSLTSLQSWRKRSVRENHIQCHSNILGCVGRSRRRLVSLCRPRRALCVCSMRQPFLSNGVSRSYSHKGFRLTRSTQEWSEQSGLQRPLAMHATSETESDP